MESFASGFSALGSMIGGLGLIIGLILHFGISKAVRWGDVKTDKKTAKRVKIGWLFQSMVVILPILGFIIGSIIDKLMR